MNTVVIWVLMGIGKGSFSFGPEFTTKEKCETAAKVVLEFEIKNQIWNGDPVCIKIEK